MRILTILFAILWAIGAPPTAAQTVQRILAVVNDEVISAHDVTHRARLNLVSSGLADNPDNVRRMSAQVLRTLIDERLQLQEAKRVGIAVADLDVNQAIGRIEQANNMPNGGVGEFLRQSGIDRSALADQIRSGIAWQRVVNRRLRPTLQISEDEIDETLTRLKESRGAAEFLLGEIFLAVDSPDQEEEIRQTGLQLVRRMVEGAQFSAVAQQFSQSASAGTGGDIGWLQLGQLDPEIEKVVVTMEPGQLTEPIRGLGGFYLMLLRQKRVITDASPDDATVSIGQLSIPVERGGRPEEIDAVMQLAETVRGAVKGCDDLARVARELNAPEPPTPARIRVGDLAASVRALVAPLKAGESTAPIRSDVGALVLMVCTREEAPSNLPLREDIADNLTRQRLDLMARRYLRDLRRAAFIDIRA